MIPVVVTMALLAVLVWAIKPPTRHVTPAPLHPLPAGPDCPRQLPEFTPSNVTDVPGPLLDGLSNGQKDRARFRLNMEPCSCGCNRSIIVCAVDNPRCQSSKRLSQKIAAEEKGEAGLSQSPQPDVTP